MNTITHKQFISECGGMDKLALAVIHQCGGWEAFTETAVDVANHGADGGFHGFIYHTETVAFAERNKAGIMDYASSMAEDLGAPDAYSLIAGFNCLHDMTADSVADAINLPRHEDHVEVMSALAWFALEEVSRRYVDILDNQGEDES